MRGLEGYFICVLKKPYMTLGTFRDQLIYPDSHEDMRRKHVKDADLEVIIEQVSILERKQRPK